jgi:2-octaprenyl-6-methoxyphenol hydroxylase
MAEYDLIIVGAGLIGASLLLALRNLDLRIALVEAKAEAVKNNKNILDQRSLVLNLGSKLYFEQLGVWDDLAQYCTEIKKIIISEQGKFNKVFLNHQSFAVSALGYVINIELLNQAIWDIININQDINKNKIDIYYSSPVQNLDIKQDYVSIHCSGKILTGKIIVAADGGRSYIRDLVKIAYDQHDYQQQALIANVTHELANNGIAYERFSEQGPFALLPRKDYFSGIVWPWPINQENQKNKENQTEYIKNLSDQELLLKLQQLFGYKLGKFKSIGERQFFPLMQIAAKKLFHNRVVLLGNAANNIHPIAGQGFNLGLRDVKSFSNLLINNKINLVTNNYNINLINDLLINYSELRVSDHETIRNSTDSLLNLFASNNKVVGIVRNLGMSICNHSYLLRSTIADLSMGLSRF